MNTNQSNNSNHALSDSEDTVKDDNLPLSGTNEDGPEDLDFPIPRPNRRQANGALTSTILQMIRILGLKETMSLSFNQSSNDLTLQLHNLLDASPTQGFSPLSTVTQPEPPTNYLPLTSATLAMHQAQFGQTANPYTRAYVIADEDSDSELEIGLCSTLSQRNNQ